MTTENPIEQLFDKAKKRLKIAKIYANNCVDPDTVSTITNSAKVDIQAASLSRQINYYRVQHTRVKKTPETIVWDDDGIPF